MITGVAWRAEDATRNGAHHPAGSSLSHDHCSNEVVEGINETLGAGGHLAAGLGKGSSREGFGGCCQVWSGIIRVVLFIGTAIIDVCSRYDTYMIKIVSLIGK